MSTTKNRDYKYFLDSMPGIAGDIARYIYDHLEWDQPGIAIAAAITFVGALKSKRFTNSYDISPHIYSCVITDSGMGKSTSQNVLVSICKASGISLEDFLMGEPKSDAAINSSLELCSRKLLLWDELGHALSALSKTKASYEAQILSTLMKVFSAGNSSYVGAEYSKRTSVGVKRIDIEKPALSVYGASTPDRFFGSLSEQFVTDGLLTRWLLFLREDKIKGKEASKYEVPTYIINEVKLLEKGQPDYLSGNISQVIKPRVQSIVFTAEAKERVKDFKESCKYKVESAKSDIERVFYTRLFEHTIKLVTIFSEDIECSLEAVEYAMRLGTHLVEGAIKASIDNLFDNQEGRDNSKMRDKVLSLFGKVGDSLTKSEIAKKLSRNSKLRNQVLNELVESDTLQHETFKISYNDRPYSKYTRIH